MNGKQIAFSAAVVGCIVVGAATLQHRPSPPMNRSASSLAIGQPETQQAAPSSTAQKPSPVEMAIVPAVALTAVSETAPTPVESTPAPSVVTPSPAKAVAPLNPIVAATAVAPSKPSGKELTLPRIALSFVGADPEAEQIWTYAINDPDRPAKERQNLIEDLNEDGFPDPKNVTADDLPLILSRIDLIEHLAPSSMDEVNAAAFGEAYKDLLQMLDRLSR